jgi:hypothetical protein
MRGMRKLPVIPAKAGIPVRKSPGNAVRTPTGAPASAGATA